MNRNLQGNSIDAIQLFLNYVLPPQLSKNIYSRELKATDSELNCLTLLQKKQSIISQKEDINEHLGIITKLFPNHYHALLALNPENPFSLEAVKKYFPEGYNNSILQKSESEMSYFLKSLFLAQEGRIEKINGIGVKVHYKDIITRDLTSKFLLSDLTGMPGEEGTYVRFIIDRLVEINIQPTFFALPKNNRYSAPQHLSPHSR